MRVIHQFHLKVFEEFGRGLDDKKVLRFHVPLQCMMQGSSTRLRAPKDISSYFDLHSRLKGLRNLDRNRLA